MNRKREMMTGALFLSGMAIILLIRNFYSFCWSDESLYMAEVHTLYLGGRPFIDEYNLSQFYAVLLLPFYKFYVKCNGGTEGIYLWARNCYLILALLTAYFTFYVMRNKMRVRFSFSIVAGLLILLYSRANVMGLSYHNIFMILAVIAAMLLLVIFEDSDEKVTGGGIWCAGRNITGHVCAYDTNGNYRRIFHFVYDTICFRNRQIIQNIS